jgi:ribosomal protein L37AE/L43A
MVGFALANRLDSSHVGMAFVNDGTRNNGERRLIDRIDDPDTRMWVQHYLSVLQLPSDRLSITTDRKTFESWLGRKTSGSIGGAYAFDRRKGQHLILINLPRIDLSKPKSLEIVVAEELVHMRDRLDGDLRRHAKHGYDRIAVRVAELTGSTMEEVRHCLKPRAIRPMKYTYECPRCKTRIGRRVQGTWSCGRCSSKFDRSLILRLVEPDMTTAEAPVG